MGAARFDSRVTSLLRLQAGVVSRDQLLILEIPNHTIQRWLRGRHLTTVVPGVYVDQTGPLTGLQRAWIGVLHAWPAALSGATALQAGLRREPTGVIEVAVDRDRKVLAPRGFRVTRRANLDGQVAWNMSPPRLRIEQVALDLAAAAGESHAAVETLAEVCRSRATTPDRLLAALEDRHRIVHREFLRGVLYDVRDGAHSILERRYLQLERAHGLPRAVRQRRDGLDGTLVVRDVDYDEFRLVVELDGHAYHDGVRHQEDLARDVRVALDDRLTLRIGWRQVFDDGCATAALVARALAGRGWRGTARPCSPTCVVARAA